MQTTPINEKLLDLIAAARKGKLVLPQFQRSFVWSRDNVTSLLVSLLQGHFIGSFLVLACDHENLPFSVRPIEGVALVSGQFKPERMLLDGQQRLTSLHYVFAAPDLPLGNTEYPYRFFLDLRKVTAGDFDTAIPSERADMLNGQLDRKQQFETLLLPFTELEQWDDWLDGYEDWLFQHDPTAHAERYRPVDRPAWRAVIGRLRDFPVPTLEIPKIAPEDNVRVGEVCAIFEKMNSSGVQLSVYDLLTARLYRHKIDLHKLWQRTMETHPLLNDFAGGQADEYGVYVLRTIALLRGLDAKSKTLINLLPEGFVADWNRAAAGMEKALRRITATNADGFGVIDKKWMPYSTMLSPLAAMLDAIETRKLDHRAYKLMRRWYWSSLFRERYAGSVESTIYRDYQDFLAAMENLAFEPAALRDARLNIVDNNAYSLAKVSRVNAIYRAVMCLVALSGAKDFQADDSIEFHDLDDHHVFPRAFLEKQHDASGNKIPKERINSIVNRTLIAGVTNRRISKQSPCAYLEKLVPPDRTREILRSHLIDDQALAAMRDDDFAAFFRARERTLVNQVIARLSD